MTDVAEVMRCNLDKYNLYLSKLHLITSDNYVEVADTVRSCEGFEVVTWWPGV